MCGVASRVGWVWRQDQIIPIQQRTHLVGKQLAGGDQIVHDQGPGALLQAVCKLNAAHVKHHRPPSRLHTHMAVVREEKRFTATNIGLYLRGQHGVPSCELMLWAWPFRRLFNAAEDVIVQSLDP